MWTALIIGAGRVPGGLTGGGWGCHLAAASSNTPLTDATCLELLFSFDIFRLRVGQLLLVQSPSELTAETNEMEKNSQTWNMNLDESAKLV